MDTNNSNTITSRKQRSSMQHLMRVTFEVAKDKPLWEPVFQRSPLKGLRDLMATYQISVKAARAVCDQIGLPRIKYGERKKKENPVAAQCPRLEALEKEVSALRQWAVRLSESLNISKP